ncbi:MAG: translocation/assembly module TamB domain-containing protein [Myxococcales bacterium]|nr:hypothetical protein [Sorangiineae bacterium PRO1]MCL4751361.1 translocation/assembly module TamB domain-containing protein [Myxococcales bacterium]
MTSNAPPKRPRRRLLARLGRALAVVLAGLVVLVLALIGYLHSQSGQELLRERVEARLAERVNGSVRLGRLGLRLFGSIELHGVVLADASGKPVIELDALSVTPSWRELSSGHIVIQRVALSGVRVGMTQDADGLSNLKRLFKPSPPSPPDPSPKRRRIEVRELALSGLAFSLTKADGSVLAVTDLGLDARLDATPLDKSVTLSVSRLGLGLTRSAPNGPKLALSELETKLEVALIEGKGKVLLGPVSAKLSLERPNVPAFATPLALSALELDVRPGGLGAALKKLEAGLALLESLELDGAKDERGLSGPQRGLVAGLALDAKRLNALLGKELLASDVKVGVALAGLPAALALEASVATDGGKLALTGKLDASKLERPGYDLTLVGTSIATKKLLLDSKAPDVEVEKLTLGLRGSGAKRDEIEADVSLDVGPLRVGKIRIDDVTLRGKLDRGVVRIRELVIHALDQTVKASGTFALAEKSLDLEVELSGDVGVALAAARRAGVAVKSNLPGGAVALGKGEFTLRVKGKLDEGLTVSLPAAKLRVAGGSVTLDGDVTLTRGEPDAEGKRPLGLDTLNTDVQLRSVRLSSLAALRGKKLPGLDGTVSGEISLQGTKQAPKADVDLTIRARRSDTREAPEVVVRVRAKGGKRELDATIDIVKRDRGSDDTIAKLDARLPITLSGRRGLDAGRPMAVKLDLPRRTLGDLLALLPPEIAAKVKAPRDTELEAHASLGGTTSAPSGQVKLDVSTKLPLSEARQRMSLDATLAGNHASASVRAFLDERAPPALTLDADARFAGSPLLPRGVSEVEWKLAGRLARQELGALPLPEDRKQGLSGTASLAFALRGTRQDAGGRVELQLSGVKKGETGPIDAELALGLEPERTKLALDVKAAGLHALRTRGAVGLGGRDLFRTLREKKAGDSSLDVNVELPKHRLAEWAALRPKLERFLGAVGGAIRLGGTLKEPTAKGEIALDEFTTASGEPGRAALSLDAGPSQVLLGIALGPSADKDPLALRVSASRPELVEFLRKKEGEATVAVRVEARAERQPLGSLVPKLTRDFPETGAQGTLDWNMTGDVALASRDGARRLADATLLGELSLSKGSVPIPKSQRRYRDVELRISATREALRIDELELHESDREKPDRRIAISGRLPWSKLRPERIELAIDAKDFLLFGSDTLGMPDAPRGALTAKIDVSGDLSGPRRRVDATVHALDLVMPDRLDKAHWPEKPHLGDVLYLGEAGVKRGKLPVPERPAPAPPPAAAPAPDSPGATGTDLFVHISKPIKVQKMPFELVAKGELAVRLRPGKKPAVSGELAVLDGYMSLGGRNHGIDRRHKSRIYFDAAHPSGELDLWVRRAPHPVVLQDVSLVSSGGDDVRLHLTGPISKPFSTVTGVGNADLWDLLPAHNAGRVKFTSQPDLPATQAVQVPREYDVVLLSYMAANLPHNLFLSRVNAWADPHDDRAAYGRVKHLEADRYSKSGKTRVRAAARPPTLGQSSAELELGQLWVNTPHTKAGAALVAGSRLGGGPALFLEWASED